MNRKTKSSRKQPKPSLLSLLIVTVTLVLLSLIQTGQQETGPVALAVTVVLTVLILTVANAADLLPATLRAILGEIRRLVRG